MGKVVPLIEVPENPTDFLFQGSFQMGSARREWHGRLSVAH